MLNPEQAAIAEQRLGQLDFLTIKPADIVLIGNEAHAALTSMLDEFLAGITRFKNPKLFVVFDNLNKGIDDAKLPKLLKKVQSGKLGLLVKIRCGFSKKKMAQAALDALTALVETHHTSLVLEAGDLLVVDNHRCVHGRSPFAARFDGTDRWLQRSFVVADLSASADDRVGRIITTTF